MENKEEGGDLIEVAEEEMILEDVPNNDGTMEAISEAAQEAELECIAEIKEENEGALANISMSSKMSQESTMESAAETHRLRNVQSCVSTH